MSRLFWKFAVLLALCIIAIILSIAFGAVDIPLSSMFIVFRNKLFGMPLPDGFNLSYVSIVWDIRIIRVLLAFFCGAALGISGTVMQSLLRNPLASPYTTGVSAGAALAVCAGIVLGIGALPVLGIAGGMAAGLLSAVLVRLTDETMNTNTIVLVGMVLSLFINAVLTLITYFSREYMQKINIWQMGSFSMKDKYAAVVMAIVCVVCLVVLMKFSQRLDLMSFGREQAGALGVNTNLSTWGMLLASTVLAGVSVAFCGIIGFVDLIAPHIARRTVGYRHINVLAASALTGGILMTMSDLASRVIVRPLELPIGAVTALIGVPFFIFVYLGRERHGGRV